MTSVVLDKLSVLSTPLALYACVCLSGAASRLVHDSVVEDVTDQYNTNTNNNNNNDAGDGHNANTAPPAVPSSIWLTAKKGGYYAVVTLAAVVMLAYMAVVEAFHPVAQFNRVVWLGQTVFPYVKSAASWTWSTTEHVVQAGARFVRDWVLIPVRDGVGRVVDLARRPALWLWRSFVSVMSSIDDFTRWVYATVQPPVWRALCWVGRQAAATASSVVRAVKATVSYLNDSGRAIAAAVQSFLHRMFFLVVDSIAAANRHVCAAVKMLYSILKTPVVAAYNAVVSAVTACVRHARAAAHALYHAIRTPTVAAYNVVVAAVRYLHQRGVATLRAIWSAAVSGRNSVVSFAVRMARDMWAGLKLLFHHLRRPIVYSLKSLWAGFRRTMSLARHAITVSARVLFHRVLVPTWDAIEWCVLTGRDVVVNSARVLFHRVVTPAFNAAVSTVRFLYDNIMVPAWNAAVWTAETARDAAVSSARFFHHNAVLPMWNAAVWTVRSARHAAVSTVRFLYRRTVVPMWHAALWTARSARSAAIASARFVRSNVLSPAWNAAVWTVRSCWSAVTSSSRFLYAHTLRPMWTAVRAGARLLRTTLCTTSNTFRNFVRHARDVARATVTGTWRAARWTFDTLMLPVWRHARDAARAAVTGVRRSVRWTFDTFMLPVWRQMRQTASTVRAVAGAWLRSARALNARVWTAIRSAVVSAHHDLVLPVWRQARASASAVRTAVGRWLLSFRQSIVGSWQAARGLAVLMRNNVQAFRASLADSVRESMAQIREMLGLPAPPPPAPPAPAPAPPSSAPSPSSSRPIVPASSSWADENRHSGNINNWRKHAEEELRDPPSSFKSKSKSSSSPFSWRQEEMRDPPKKNAKNAKSVAASGSGSGSGSGAGSGTGGVRRRRRGPPPMMAGVSSGPAYGLD